MAPSQKRAFYVVQFIELPFEGIDDYVCVPASWLIVLRARDQKAVIAYPKDEDPFDTRDRARRKERCDDQWRYYMAAVKYKSDTYRDAEYWIATRNDYGPLVEEESNGIDMQPRVTFRSDNQRHLSNINDDTRKLKLRISIKRPALSEPKKQLDGKRLKLDEPGQSSSAVVSDANAELGCSKREQLNIQDNHSMEYAQKENTGAASCSESSSSQRAYENLRQSSPTQELNMPLLDFNTPTVKEAQPTSFMEQQLSSNQVLSQFAEQPEPAQEPQMSEAPSSINDQEPRTNDVIVNEPTSRHLLNSLKISDHLYSHMRGGRRLVPIQKPIEKRIRPMNAFQTDECMVTSDSDAVADHEVIANREMYFNEAPVETTDNVYCTGTAIGSRPVDRPMSVQNCTSINLQAHNEAPVETTDNVYCTGIATGRPAGRPTVAQNSTSTNQTHPRVVLEQQMLDNFRNVFTQMGSTLRYTSDMYNNLRSSISETADTYQKLLNAVGRFNTGEI